MNRFDIGRRIVAYREKMKMSTQELAEGINRSQATISRIENGKQGLTFELLAQIAAELRVHPFALLSDEPLRASVLMPACPDTGGYPPNLLANALHAGRLRRRFSIGIAANMLGISDSELESIELAISSPDDMLLTRLSELYGLEVKEMRFLQEFGRSVPETARSLAYLQQVCSQLHNLLVRTRPGEEAATLQKTLRLLEAADHAGSLHPGSVSDDIELFLNRLSLHLVNALKGDALLSTLKQAGLHAGLPDPLASEAGLVQTENGNS